MREGSSMNIEVATPLDATTKQKGDLLEQTAAEFLKTQGFEVHQQVRSTASELDLLCKHKVNKRVVYAECKAQRETLSANILTQLLGTIGFHKYQEGWLISTGPLGKDAKGFQNTWENQPTEEAQRLSIYTPERILERLIDAKIIKSQPSDKALNLLKSEDLAGSWTLLITPFGKFWALTCLSAGIPEGVLIFSALTSELIDDPRLLKNISQTDASIRNLDFEFVAKLKQMTLEPASVVEVQHGNSWVDYRPARPEDFVGRQESQDKILGFLEDVRDKRTLTRVFAITGDSGMGKSSLIAKVRARTQNQRLKNRVFIYAVDVRAATDANYIFASLVACLRRAANEGFGSIDPANIKIDNVSEPLESSSIKDYINSLEQNGQIVCLIFDQFEELYSKSDLYDIFDLAQRLFLSVTSAKSNFVLGFAWKSDATVPQSHPAYFMWHRLADHRLEIELKRFRHDEASAAINLFEKELGKPLIANLKRQLLENTQGYPWWLKKLCIHVYDQISSGTSQEALIDKALDVESLFTRDLQKLTAQEKTCLKLIAENAPIDWYEMLEISGNDVLRALIDKRLIIRRGNRLTVYWDIFREYVVSGKIPSIPLTYLPSYDSLNTVLMIAKQLSKDSVSTYEQLSEIANISPSTVVNVVHDLVMFGVAKRDNSEVSLDERVTDSDTESILRRLRQTFLSHAVVLILRALPKGTIIDETKMIEILKQINPTAQHQGKTWKVYANRMVQWLTATGYIAPSQSGWATEDRGDINSDFAKISVGYYSKEHFFIGDSSPAYALKALEWLINNKTPVTSWSQFQENNLRNAAQTIRNLGIIVLYGGQYVITEKYRNYNSPLEILWVAALNEKTLKIAKRFMQENPSSSGRDLGKMLNKEFERNWSDTSIERIGNSLRQWAHWLILGDVSDSIPDPLGARYKKSSNTKQQSLFEE
jgi:hypothetical protein